MFILRAIGRFFVRIGRWIKDTAWVQPLLIVGGIFAIIFSIPYITSWVGSWFSGSNESTNFYSKYKESLDGAQNETPNSDANKLFNYMLTPVAEQSASDQKKYGQKFFVVFVDEECSGCKNLYKSFEILRDEWNKGSFATPEGQVYNEFKMYTIFTDETDDINNETKNLFTDYFYNSYDAEFEELMAVLQDSDYAKNKGDSYKKELDTLDKDSFKTPTVFLYDPTGRNSNQLGVTEALFTVEGKNNESGVYPVAYTLFDCWYHQDIFGPNYIKN